jgi:hypothetical protein
LGIIMRRHDELCGLLVGELSKIKGNASTADAQLTVLANWVDDQVGLPSTDAQRPPPLFSMPSGWKGQVGCVVV